MYSRNRLAALPALALATLAVAACGKQDSIEAENESASSVAEKVAKSNIKPMPGRWQSSMKIEKLEIANMPPEAKAMMQKQMGAMQSFFTCLTPEQVDKPNAGFFQQDASGCTYEKFSMSGGRIDAAVTCKHGQHAQKMTMSGQYSPESYNITMSSNGEMQPGMPMSMVMSIAAKRIGECNGKEES
jgi:Protein of unknown function (DUF3617)